MNNNNGIKSRLNEVLKFEQYKAQAYLLQRVQKIVGLVKHIGEGCSLKSLCTEHISEGEIRLLAKQFPHYIFISQEGLVYVDPLKIAYQKIMESDDLSLENKSFLEVYYSSYAAH
ncbi:hypothetical protein bcgnr5378_06580 [Bacillus cereus]|uniref:hypothetical protein n=1 Tax=Bacillus cereus TaxID=1396 RepID=UPI0007ABF2C4|nr:hypothetical protein [Bacillus cereus]